jgi:hypothetical protein
MLRFCLQFFCAFAIFGSQPTQAQTTIEFPVRETISASSDVDDSSLIHPLGLFSSRNPDLSLQASNPLPQNILSSPNFKTPPGFGHMFIKAWVPITAAEFGLLGITASLPKSWTGWSAHFVRDGINHLERAYTRPPVWDDDWWVHNYVGHPYGGSLYYNSVRSQGATPAQSMLMATVLSTQWEYFFEAFAERPSIQDLIVTPVAGSILGELSHQLTLKLEKGGTNTGEKILILVTNPMHVAFDGF